MSRTLLTIAGFDPTSGAGILLDLKAFHRLGFEGTAVITSVTAQNTEEVDAVFGLSPEQIKAQAQTLIRDIPPAGIKIGMIGRRDAFPVLRDILESHRHIPRIVDPVLKSTSGTPLLETGGVDDFVSLIRNRVSLLTPNAEDAAVLGDCRIRTTKDMERAAVRIHGVCRCPCLIKGGHLPGPAVDILYDGRDSHAFSGKRIGKRVHGTGCYLSASILAYLVLGHGLVEACRRAKLRTREAMRAAADIGSGQAVIPFGRPLRTE